jgi:hypothetical protein
MTNEELTKQEREAALAVLRARIEFAKYGFRGTLFGAFAAIASVLLLAIIDGILAISLHPSVYVTLIVASVTATISYGFFSLWSLPHVDADLLRGTVAVRSGTIRPGIQLDDDALAKANGGQANEPPALPAVPTPPAPPA